MWDGLSFQPGWTRGWGWSLAGRRFADDTVADYAPTLPEILISLGIYAAGVLILTLFYRIVLSVREEANSL